uniref:Uncharacterized protein n=1 Tax=Clastoptera arizonana TaxID=38151 RepID=A0A1B6D627_9HEMI
MAEENSYFTAQEPNDDDIFKGFDFSVKNKRALLKEGKRKRSKAGIKKKNCKKILYKQSLTEKKIGFLTAKSKEILWSHFNDFIIQQKKPSVSKMKGFASKEPSLQGRSIRLIQSFFVDCEKCQHMINWQEQVLILELFENEIKSQIIPSKEDICSRSAENPKLLAISWETIRDIICVMHGKFPKTKEELNKEKFPLNNLEDDGIKGFPKTNNGLIEEEFQFENNNLEVDEIKEFQGVKEELNDEEFDSSNYLDETIDIEEFQIKKEEPNDEEFESRNNHLLAEEFKELKEELDVKELNDEQFKLKKNNFEDDEDVGPSPCYYYLEHVAYDDYYNSQQTE